MQYRLAEIERGEGMARSQDLYKAICSAVGKESLTDAEIHKIVLFLQRRLRQSGDAVDLGVGEFVYVDADPHQCLR